MEFIQRKTADKAVDGFLSKAAEKGISLAWDRYEKQLPQCGFCESGLNCRDCLQGPCISHPFRDESKVGVCGKDKDILGIHSLLRLVLQGTMSYLDQLSDFAKGVESGEISPKNKGQADQIIKQVYGLFGNGETEVLEEFPEALIDSWKARGIYPEGIGRDLFKASQKLEGGIASVNDTLLWAFKSSLLGCVAQRLQGRLKRSVFGDIVPTELEVNLGVLQKGTPNILLYGHFSPLLKQKIAELAEKKKVGVMGVCTDPLLPPYSFSPVTNYASQEIPLMTGAVDLIVAGDQFVNPSLVDVAREWNVTIVPTEVLNRGQDLKRFAEQIVDQAKKAFDARSGVSRDIPDVKESAVMGFSAENVDVKKIVKGINAGKIKGIAILAGSNNVKFTQDKEIVSMALEFLKNDVFCISEGEASVSLAKRGFLNPQQQEKNCGKGLSDLLSSLGENIPSILDFGGSQDGGVTDFLLGIARAGTKQLKDYPIIACFPEANRGMEVAKAIWTVATGISTYFWPHLPVTGSPKTMEALGEFCEENFGAKLKVVTEKMEAAEKAALLMKGLERV